MEVLILPLVFMVIGAIACLAICIGVAIIIVQKYYLNKTQSDIDKTNLSKERIAYSKDVLDYIKTFAAQIIVLRFQAFIDSHHLEKVTREKFKNVVGDIINEIHDSINIDGFDHDLLLYDDKFINKYLIQTCMTMCKKMLTDALIEFDE